MGLDLQIKQLPKLTGITFPFLRSISTAGFLIPIFLLQPPKAALCSLAKSLLHHSLQQQFPLR